MSLVVGIDPGRRSASALHLAAMLARSVDTDLVVVAVLPQVWPTNAGTVDAEWRAFTREHANAALDHAAAVLGGSISAEYLIHESSSVRRGLMEFADRHGAEFIVVGSSASGPVGRITLGSEIDSLLHSSRAAVAIAPQGFRVRGDARVSRVTIAYRDGSSAKDAVLGAAEAAAEMHAELRIASFAVVPPGSGSSGAGFGVEQRIADAWRTDIAERSERMLAEVAKVPNAPRAAAAIESGRDWDDVLASVEWDPEEVLVVGSSSLGTAPSVFLGSRAAKIVRHSPVPVIVLPRRSRSA